MKKYEEYFDIVQKQLKATFESEGKNIETAAGYVADSIQKGGVMHVFGCGHSQIFAMEVFYRAGGLVPVNALLLPHLALFPKAKLSTLEERMEGFADQYLDIINTNPYDTMVVASISGRNAAVVDMALAAHKKGMKVVTLVSRNFSDSVTSRHSSGKKLIDAADLVIDVKCESGDAALEIQGLEAKFCGTSTVLGVAIMEAVVAQTVEICHSRGIVPPIYVSSNLDRGDKINAEYIEKYHNQIECL